MFKTRIRARPENDYAALYHGSVYLYPVSMQYIHILEDAALWYMEFSMGVGFSQYFGVLDFDISRETGSTDQEYQQKKEATLEIIDALLSPKFKYYQVYDSGNKGYHVYVYDMRNCWLEPPADLSVGRMLWIRAQLRNIYGDELYDLLDISNHCIGKGIRPYTCVHPKTGVRPLLLKQTPGCPPVFWEWFIDNIYIGILPTIVEYRTVTPILDLSNASIDSTASLTPEIVHTRDNELDSAISAVYLGECLLEHKERNLYLVRNTNYCCFLKATHKSQKNYIYKYPHHAYIACHSGKCRGASKYVSAKSNPLTDTEPLLPGHPHKKILGPDVPYILKEDIEWSLSRVGFGAIFAPMGSGKTKALEDWIDLQPPSFSYLLIVVRKTQASYFSHRYRDLTDYQTTRNSLYEVPRLVCCINSLERLLAPDGSLPHYDMLILDEIESIIAALVSKILSSGRTEQCSIWNIFGTLIKSAERTLIMDGIPTYHSINYFKSIGIMEHFSIVEHHRQPDFRVYKCFCHQQDFIDQMKSDLDNNKNVVLVSNTKEIQTLIYSKIDCDSKLMINADSEKKIKNTSKKPNEKWDVRFLAYNTAVGAGASFDLDHFHIMYAVVSPNSCIPQDFYQLICRIRKLKESKVSLLVMDNDDATGPVPTRDELKFAKVKNIKNFHQLQSNYRSQLTILQTNPTEHIRLDICELDYKLLRVFSAQRFLKLKHEDNLFLDTLVEFEHEKLCLRNNIEYCKNLFTMIRRNGGIVTEIRENQQDILKSSSRMMKGDARKLSDEMAVTTTKNTFWDPDPGFDPVLAKVWNKLVNFNDMNTQYRWMALRRRLIIERPEVYQQEFTTVNDKNRALSNIMLFSVSVLESIDVLSTICPFTVNRTTGKITGRASIIHLHEHSGRIASAITSIYEQLFHETQVRHVFMAADPDSTPSKINLTLCKNIRKMFKLFGINTTYHSGRGARVSVRGNRMITSEYEFCEETQNIRMAMANLEYDTGDRSGDAINYYLNKGNSNP